MSQGLLVSGHTISISELKSRAAQFMAEADGEAVAVLSHNKPVFYAVPPDVFESMVDCIEDMHLSKRVAARIEEGYKPIAIDFDDL